MGTLSRAVLGVAWMAVASTACRDGRSDDTSVPGPDAVVMAAGPSETRFQATVVLEFPSAGAMIEHVTDVKAGVDGQILVLDGMAQDVKIYDESGNQLAVLGRRGRGPGEFGAGLSTLLVTDGLLHVPDLSEGRVTTFDLGTLELVSTFRVDARGALPMSWAQTESGAVLVGLQQIGQAARFTVATFRNGELTLHPEVWPGRPSATDLVIPTLVGGPADCFALGDQELGEIHLYEDPGERSRTLKWREPPIPISASARAYIREELERDVPARRQRRFQTLLDQVPSDRRDRVQAGLAPSILGISVPESYPLCGMVRLDGEGRVWIARPLTVERMQEGPYLLPWREMKYVSPVWEIYDERGEHLMTVDLPFAIAVTDIEWPTLLGYRIMEDETRRVTVLHVESSN